MYLSLARATSRIVSPSLALHNSPSIRTEICLGIAVGSLSVLQGADITTQAATGLLAGLLGSERQHGLLKPLHSLGRGQWVRMMTAASAGLWGRRLVVVEGREQLVEAVRSHEALVDKARASLAVTHRVGDVGCPG